MRFKLDGEPFELTPEIVRQRLAGHTPEAIRSYWVEIDSTRWPVKQVISLATGADRGRFQSQASQRWLRNLGFEVGGGESAGGAPKIGHRSARATSLRPEDLEEIETIDVRVTFAWLRAGSVTLDPNLLPRFPSLPKQPGLYRFDFGLDASGVRTLYVGESVELARRGSNYRNAKTDRSRQRTSRRIHKEVVAHLTAGGSIEFAIATSVRWTAADEELDLRLKSARRLAENAAVLLAQTHPSTRVLNIDADLGADDEEALHTSGPPT